MTTAQSLLVRLVNQAGRQLQKRGYVAPALEPESLLQTAASRTGLDDFGDTSFQAGLTQLLKALNSEANLSPVGRIVAYFNVLDYLCVRLKLVQCRKERPEIAEQQISQPLFILGLPRSGTSILYELIAQDPAMRSPSSWEVAKPIPPPQRDNYLHDKRIRGVDFQLGFSEKLSPGFRAIHSIAARLPQECVYMFSSHFMSEQYGYMYNIPEYRDWMLSQNMSATYQWHQQFLQHLQVDFAAERWVLKTPSHMAYLQNLLAQYPDALIVWTHRDPLDATASFASLVTTLQRGFSDDVSPNAVAKYEVEHLSRLVHRGMEQRRELDTGQFFDVGFGAICEDPISVVRGIYHYFSLDLTATAEQAMVNYLQRRPRDLYGNHDYSCEKFGLGGTADRDLFQEYILNYGQVF